MSSKVKERGRGDYTVPGGYTIIRYDSNDSIYWQGSEPSSTIHESEGIRYESLPESLRVARNCVHQKERWVTRPITGKFQLSGPLYAEFHNLLWYQSRDAIVGASSPLPSGLSSDAEAFSQRAFEAMLPDLEQGLSLTNFIFELTDVKHLLTFATKWSKDLLRKVSEGHLSYSFGVRPFLSDAAKIYYILQNYRDILQDFMDRQGELQTRHYTEPAEIIDGNMRFYDSVNVKGDIHDHLEIKRHATMSYKYTTPDVFGKDFKLKALRDMLGLRITPSTVWEAIPFSFVVDWFFRVQDWLKSYEKPLVPVTCTIMDYCISEKTVQEANTYCQYYSLPTNAPMLFNDFTMYRKAYIRKRCVPPDLGSTFINRGQYGRNQLALSLSLINVRRRRG